MEEFATHIEENFEHIHRQLDEERQLESDFTERFGLKQSSSAEAMAEIESVLKNVRQTIDKFFNLKFNVNGHLFSLE